ncbi:iron-sulfur cluster assembly protein [Klebsormidium nitens]|uniref:Iron-sulfur cluster assembly protein n=1 Tax=Klebsormidium nitens TaxID=105231 RepID=A0A1Y1HPE9_KLENI|nr:iron-sulfur cluster assembly protein [Klebsormidium nitens]|eukprot:GAQ79079.1 iron-sulfur cluster assembly protein [Klebsormidium nitens]
MATSAAAKAASIHNLTCGTSRQSRYETNARCPLLPQSPLHKADVVHSGLKCGASRKAVSRVGKTVVFRQPTCVKAAVSTSEAPTSTSTEPGKVLLEVEGLEAEVADGGRQILKGLNITIREGEVHAIMGKNGSGKSTLSKVLVGHPDYDVTGGSAKFKGKDLFELEPEERSHAGLFLSFQSPVEVPGVSNTDFLRMAHNARRQAQGLKELDPLEFYAFLTPKLDQLKMDASFLSRNVNEGFSGGEKKRNEILQLAVLEADLAILDEIDSGLDIDALRDVAEAVNGLRKSNNAVLLITHYQRLLDYITPDFVHIMQSGRIVKTGGKELAKELEQGGYGALGPM